MMRNLVSELIKYGRVTVTQATASDLVSLADKMVTLGKRGDLHARRQAASMIKDIYVDEAKGVTAIQKLFNEIAPKYQDRNGGYTRSLKLDARLGDNSPMCVVEFV
jgi:large subunit ribosomal protein L17